MTFQEKLDLRSRLKNLSIFKLGFGFDTYELIEFILADRKKHELQARIAELNKIALDNYRGKTVSELTNWQAKFEYFMDNNERRIAELKAQQEEV